MYIKYVFTAETPRATVNFRRPPKEIFNYENEE